VTLLGQGVGLGDPQRSLPTPTMLGFCDSVTDPSSTSAAAKQSRSQMFASSQLNINSNHTDLEASEHGIPRI